MKYLILSTFGLWLLASHFTLAAPLGSDPVQLINFNVDDHLTQTANVPSLAVIKTLYSRFKEAKTPLSHGDLKLGRRWDCREYFAEASGYTNFRFRGIRLERVESGILEDQLNYSPRFFTYQNNMLIGASNTREGDFSEIRIDHDGNLRIASFSAGYKLKSLMSCYSAN